MKVISYLRAIPPRNKNAEKEEVLKRFIQGVKLHGDEGIASKQDFWSASDLAVLQGFVHENSSNSPHLMLRKTVLQNQKLHNKKTCIIDSNLFLYADPGNTKRYLRYSLDGVFPNTGEYFWDNPDSNRWKSISKNLNIALKDYRTSGEHILICLQRNGGWSMGGLDVMEWCKQAITHIRKHSDRKIVVRAHPGDKKAREYLKLNYKNVEISKNTNITDDFRKCWSVVTFNSSPAVAAAIEGIPVFVTDPIPKTSQAFPVANTNLNEIENPQTFDRQNWIEKISMCHWNFSELTNGEAWKHIKGYV
jgi:hypothetical protein